MEVRQAEAEAFKMVEEDFSLASKMLAGCPVPEAFSMGHVKA